MRGLREKTEYTIEVRARNGSRASGAGAIAKVTTRTLAIPRPTITEVRVTSDPNDDGRAGDDDTYAIGDTIGIELTFSEKVDATGTPKVRVRAGPDVTTGGCTAATDTVTLECEYSVAEGDDAPEGLTVPGLVLDASSGTVTEAGSNLSATLYVDAALTFPSHKVDGVRPGPARRGGQKAETTIDGTVIELQLNEAVAAAAAAKFRIEADTGGVQQDEAATSVTIDGQSVKVSHETALTEESTINLRMKVGAVTDRAGNENPERLVRVNNNITAPSHPSAVRNLRAVAGNQQAHLYWDDPEVAAAGKDDTYIHQYEYRQKPSPGGWTDWTETPQSPPVNGMTADGLDNGTSYSFQVRAVNRHKLSGPDGPTVTATPVARYSASLSRWGIRRGGGPTEVTLGVGDGPFREARTYTMHWNDLPVNRGLLHRDNPTSITLPAGRNQASVNLRAAADDDGPDKVYNREVEHPLIFKYNGSEVVRTKPGGLYDGNLSVHDNESEPVISLEAPESVAEGEDFQLTVRMSHRLEDDAVVGFGFSNPSRAKWNLSGVPEPGR